MALKNYIKVKTNPEGSPTKYTATHHSDMGANFCTQGDDAKELIAKVRKLAADHELSTSEIILD